ncbi:MAG TPA: hypothetical protein VME23_12370 [Terracidiphilus sp.]|jgi:hypothetical protein|nr:hypothetical protein [Terracidiphilus sp.]
MTLVSCPCEKEIRELVESGQWPLASPPELRSHAEACRTCADLVLVAGAFQRARSVTLAAAKPASAGAIWWRAQLRSRQQAFERIQRPLIGAQVFALVALLLPIIGFIAYEARHGLAWLNWFSDLSQSAALHAGGVTSASSSGSASGLIFVVVAAATFVLIAGAAVFFATERK